jgi:hypothetical protein
MADLAVSLIELCGKAARILPEPHNGEAAALGTRLQGPLRIAIAGRIKAGKSTLLNALVGERMAPTDAGECTRLVTWYRHGVSYEVQALLRDGAIEPLPFTRADHELQFDVAGRPLDTIDRIDVRWPSAKLEELTLIDTPGLASINDEASARSEEFLSPQDRSSDADAVIYLMRHVHRNDVEYLDAFLDRSVAHASPINAIGVLSRADEIGGGRLDSLASADRIAARYRSDSQLQTLCSTVLPVAGLLAETGGTLRQDEYAALRSIAAEDEPTLDAMLITADRTLTAGLGPVTIEVRRALLARFGLFGLRFAVDRIRSGAASNAPALAAALVDVSGIGEIRKLLATRFLPRARVLQARGVLAGLRSLARAAATADPETSRSLSDELERIEATSSDLSDLRLLHLSVAGVARLTDAESLEVRRLILGSDYCSRLDMPGVGADDARAAALEGIERWRSRAADPRNDPATVEACELAARAYEGVVIELGS